MAFFFAIGQRPITVKPGPAGEIFITQWDYESDRQDRLEIDPIFVPTLIKWLQELIAPEAVN